RAENLARFVDVTYQLNLDLPTPADQQWQPLVSTTGDQAWFAQRYGEANRENVVRFLTFDADYPNSIISCLRAARENARSIRETISSEMWEQLNHFFHMVNAAADDEQVLQSPQVFFNEVKLSSHLFRGITDGTMSHGEGWHFVRLGRHMERADKTSRILDVKYYVLLPKVTDVGTPVDDVQWSAVLRSVSGFEMFRKRHHGITPERVVDFLMLDRLFPRAIMYCLNAANDSLHAIAGSPHDTFTNIAEKRMGQLRSDLAYTQVPDIMSCGLHEFVDKFQKKLNAAGAAIYETFIALRSVPEAFSSFQEQESA
ncbi:MAG: alpha-E domain-containing protein, partial [Pirellulaceae bacterium]